MIGRLTSSRPGTPDSHVGSFPAERNRKHRTKDRRKRNDRNVEMLRMGRDRPSPVLFGVSQRERPVLSRLSGTERLLGDETESTEARVERAATETERRGGARLVALRSPQRLDDGLLLDHGERLRLRRGVVD